jgi:hypothetical protein
MRATAKVSLVCAVFLLPSSVAFLSRAQDFALPHTRPASCQAPLKYRIGALDQRFGISREEFRHAIEDASKVLATDQKLFQYDPRGKLRINLVYDTRQEITQRVIAVRARISARMKEADGIKEKFLPLEDNFRAFQDTYSDQLASYDLAQDSYNQDVKRWNSSGGAPEGEVQRLMGARRSLRERHGLLEKKRL